MLCEPVEHEEQRMSHMLTEVSWEDVKAYFCTEMRQLAETKLHT